METEEIMCGRASPPAAMLSTGATVTRVPARAAKRRVGADPLSTLEEANPSLQPRQDYCCDCGSVSTRRSNGPESCSEPMLNRSGRKVR